MDLVETEAPTPKREKRDRHVTIHLTPSLDRWIERRRSRLPHEPTKSSWIFLVLKREKDRIEREEAARSAPPQG